jgi:nucleoside-diphosphate-sugar epimerase
MNILVIGGTGFYGKVVVRELLDRGDSVTVYSRGNSQPDFWGDIEHIQGDRDQHDQFVRDLSGKSFDAVIDNVAFGADDARAAISAFQGNVGKYLVMSSISIYGALGHALKWVPKAARGNSKELDEFVDLSVNHPLEEDAADLTQVSWESNSNLAHYAERKRQLERVFLENPDFPSTVFRAPIIVGPEASARRIWWYLERMQDGQEILLRDGGSNHFSLGYRDDIARAMIAAMDSPNTTNQTYNIGQDEQLTLSGFLDVLADIAELKLNTISVPSESLDQQSNLPYSDWWYDPFSRPEKYLMSMDKARRYFNLTNTPMSEWLRTIVDWYRSLDQQAPSFGYEYRDDEVAFARGWQSKD